MNKIYTNLEPGTTKTVPDTVPDTALRFDQGKPEWHLVHFKSLEPLVSVLMFGRDKYGAFNWQKPFEKERILNSAMRHLMKLMDGEELDSESGLPHIGHLMANAMFYSYHYGMHNKGNTNNTNNGPGLGDIRGRALARPYNFDISNQSTERNPSNTGSVTEQEGNYSLT